MAGIKVPQYEIFKIGTNKLKHNNWNIIITKDDARLVQELIPLFEAQEFRLIFQILKDRGVVNKKWKIDYSQYICSIVIENKSDFSRATSRKGIKINGKTFKRFVGTTGGLKNNTLLFVSDDIIDELNTRCECGRNKKIALVPAKYEAYKALTCSASQEIISPNKILVVRDCFTKFRDEIILLDNNNPKADEKGSPTIEHFKDAEIENNVSDGFNLCTIEYMKKVSEALGLDYVTNGVCLRNAWLKGMLYPFPIVEFFDKYMNGNYMVQDIWGDTHDIRDCEMIVTESSLKLWSAYSSIYEYMEQYKKNGYEFSVTKISPHKLDDTRELNYQYLQSYEFDEKDIEEICQPTIEFLKNSLCGDYQSTIDFLGITGNEDVNSWQKALLINEYMLGDPYVIDSVHRMIKKKINNAKIGKLIVDGNYQIASGDPYALMQSICGLEVTGLLKANECYSSYWNNKDVSELVIFRSPMTSHNNIRKCTVINNEDVNYWYQYMDNIMIINGWDTFCQAENGCDWDSDILFSTNNPVLIRKHRRLPAVVCSQSNTEKVIVKESDIKKTNKNGMGNQVGTITNRVTAMMEVQSRFEKGSKEYEELSYRIACGQLYQQDELDKIKGIIAKPMPASWYIPNACETEFERSISINKKPYFMTYVYDDYRKKHKKYIDDCNHECMRKNEWGNLTVAELYALEDKNEEQLDFIKWYEIKMPFGMGNCTMNNICYYVEDQFEGYKTNLKKKSDFDYNVLKVKRRCTEKHRNDLFELSQLYIQAVAIYKNKKLKDEYSPIETIYLEDENDKINARLSMRNYFYNKAKEICPDDDERLNIILDMCYGYKNNKQFCWDCIGDLICKRLEELKDE